MGIALRAEDIFYEVSGAALLRDVTLSLRTGTFHALIGPNGAGKSTLLQMLAGDIIPGRGTVYLDERPLPSYSKKELALRRAVMPQDVVLSLAFTGEEVVMMGRYPHMTKDTGNGRPKAEDHHAVVNRAMRDTESASFRERLYPSLSGGEQARVTLARVLAQQTPVVFLDEPTASLDPRHQHLVMHLARRCARRGGTVLAVLHDLNLAAAYADDIVLLSDGQIRAQGPPADVLKPDLLKAVFQTDFHVAEYPLLPHPLVLSLPRGE